MKKCTIYFSFILIFFSACVSQKKYELAMASKDKAIEKQIIAEDLLKKEKSKSGSMLSNYADSIKLYLEQAQNYKIEAENKLSAMQMSFTNKLKENALIYTKDTDTDGIPDYMDKESNTHKGNLVDKQGKTIHPVKSGKDESGKLTDIPIGHAIQSYCAVSHCPDSIEVNTPGYIEVLIDFTTNQDSIDIDILEVAINHTDTTDTRLIKKRIFKKDICSLAKYLKIVVSSDAGSPLLITPEPSSDEYVKVSELFSSKRIYKWKVRCAIVGTYGYTIHVIWYNTNKGQPTTLRQDEITSCPNKITVYEIPKTNWAKFTDIFTDNIWKGISAAIAFFLGFIGKEAWAKIARKKTETA